MRDRPRGWSQGPHIIRSVFAAMTWIGYDQKLPAGDGPVRIDRAGFIFKKRTGNAELPVFQIDFAHGPRIGILRIAHPRQ